MKAVIQRVSEASVKVGSETISKIGPGILTLLGIEKGDTEEIVSKGIQKILTFRIFADTAGKMNLSLLDTKGEHLIVSQFTLAADTESGRRPSFTNAEAPERARALYEFALLESSKQIKSCGGSFQADMKVSLVNDGPVTFIF